MKIPGVQASLFVCLHLGSGLLFLISMYDVDDVKKICCYMYKIWPTLFHPEILTKINIAILYTHVF